MTKYLPCIELTPAIEEPLRYGTLPLQRGQWLSKDGKMGRYIRTAPKGVLYISWVHTNTGEQALDHSKRFSRAVAHYKEGYKATHQKSIKSAVSEYRQSTPFTTRIKDMFL